MEPVGKKSHVISDWVTSCIEEGKIQSVTNGMEERQFLHVEDCARAIVAAGKLYGNTPNVMDVSSGRWSRLREVASLVSSLSPRECTIAFSDKLAVVRERLDPDQTSVLYDKW